MHLRNLIRRLSALPGLRLPLWAPFLIGWLQRKRNRFVPCALPACNELLQIPLEDFYRSYAYFSETRPGRTELTFFLQKLRAHEVLYDVGAYRGAYSAAAKARSRAGVSVHLFEPVAKNYEAIRRIGQMNRFSDFQVVPLAAADGGHLQGTINADDLVFSSAEGNRSAHPVDLQAISLDEYVAQGAAPPSLLKVDVDGFELAVLRGAKQCLARERPHLWLEIHPAYLRNQGSSQEEVLEFLRAAGYTIDFFEDHRAAGAAMAFHVWCE